jgi:hypothetical protein
MRPLEHCLQTLIRYRRVSVSRTRPPPAYSLRRFVITSQNASSNALDWPHSISVSNFLTVKRSVFLAHASILPSHNDLASFIGHLRAHHEHASRLRRATHCMTAWRSPDGRSGEDEDGERGAGARLAHLLDAAPCEARKDGVVLVVWRWYGGTPLGGERWKCISTVGKEALRGMGFAGTNQAQPELKTQAMKTQSRKRRR